VPQDLMVILLRLHRLCAERILADLRDALKTTKGRGMRTCEPEAEGRHPWLSVCGSCMILRQNVTTFRRPYWS
jgi:hypothetical protein